MQFNSNQITHRAECLYLTLNPQAAVTALELGPGGGDPVQGMLKAFQQRKDFVAGRLRAIEGVQLAEPQGAFYVLPDMSAFFGPGAEAKGFGPVPDSDTFCRSGGCASYELWQKAPAA